MKITPPNPLSLALTPLKFGPITIPVHPADKVKSGVIYPGYRFKITLGGQVFERHRTTLAELRAEAQKLVEAYNRGQFSTQQEVMVLSGDVLARYYRILDLEKQLGGSLVSVLTDEVIPAKIHLQKLPGVSLARAAITYVAQYGNCRSITVKGAITRFLAAKATKGISKGQMRRYRRILAHLDDKYGHKQMTELTTTRVRAFLRGLPRQIRNKNRHRRLHNQLPKLKDPDHEKTST